MAVVHTWPPVAAVAKFWNLDQPISKSYSMVTGRRFASAAQLPRRRVRITVSGRLNNGRGYMAALERLLRGGRNFVRLTSCRMAFGLVDVEDADRMGNQFDWRQVQDPATEFEWAITDLPVDPFVWFEGVALQAELGGGGTDGYNITITDPSFIPGTVIALPGEFITVLTALHPEGETHMVANVVRVNSSNTANIKLVTPLSGPGRVNFNTSETGIFELNSEFPQLGYDGADIPNITLDFREVFPEEIPEGLTEVNRWT